VNIQRKFAEKKINDKIRPFDIKSFPSKLYQLLEYVEAEGLSHIVSWQPNRKAFKIHKPDTFMTTIAPKYFEQSKFTSFKRQLNLYGFRRFTSGPDSGAYYHVNFLQGDNI